MLGHENAARQCTRIYVQILTGMKIRTVSDVSDVFKIVFWMYCVGISDVLEFRTNGSLQAF
jgi:hypothetical protein